MKKNNIIITTLLIIIVMGLYFVDKYYDYEVDYATKAYQVYLNGETLGFIKDKDKLYELINEEQQEIKEKYKVDNVYPPDGIDIIETNTYRKEKIIDIQDIYNKIENLDDYTVKGYIITIKPLEGDKIIIKVLDKNVFEEALKNFIFAFISEKDYEKYVNNDYGLLSDVGYIIKDMNFSESITIKEGYISVKDNIFTDVDTLSQYILFGPNAKKESYTVQLGDDIESVSEKFDLNPEEFIIANPEYTSVDTMLRVGDKVNINLIDPLLTYNYKKEEIKEETIAYSDNKTTDNSKPSSYKEISVQGVTGIERIQYTSTFSNGEQNNDVEIGYKETIRAKIDQITVVGKKKPSYTYVNAGQYVELDGVWGWPTNSPYIITSKYGMRKGKMHQGIDISGTGWGSNIYAARDGVVTQTVKACKKPCVRWSNGTYVVIKHDDNIYTGYLHLSSYSVKVGDVVKKGQIIGRMGSTGNSTGPHLHFGLYKGEPYVGGTSTTLNPLTTIYKTK